MLNDPRYGWCDFKLKHFYGTPSYVQNVPIDILTAFYDYYTKGSGLAFFDEEGSYFTLVLTPYDVYIIEDREETILHSFKDVYIIELLREVVRDIEINIDEWAKFTYTDDKNEIEANRGRIMKLIFELKRIGGIV